MSASIRDRNVLMVLVGVVCLLFKRWYAGFLGSVAFSYAGNLSASFAVYFIIALAPIPQPTRVTITVLALLVVEGFELTNGFGMMTNVYDPFDYLANALGIAVAVIADAGSARFFQVARHSA